MNYETLRARHKRDRPLQHLTLEELAALATELHDLVSHEIDSPLSDLAFLITCETQHRRAQDA